MRIELLVFEDCPNLEPARELLQAGMASLGIAGDVQEILVETPEAARQWDFPGSPTLRVNGEDVAPLPEGFEPAIGCRTYVVQGRRQGLPDSAWVLEALRKAQDTESHNCCPLRGPQTGTGPTKPEGLGLMAGHRTVISAVLLGVAASACCWLPLTLAGLGMATGTLGAKIAWIRPWALGALAFLLAGVIAWWALKRYGDPFEKDYCCMESPRFPTLPVVLLGLSFLGATAAPRLLHPGGKTTLAGTMAPIPARGTLLVLSTPQVDCPSCVGKLHQTLAATPGTATVQMDFDKRETRIVFQQGSAVDATLARWKKELGFEGNVVKREAASVPSQGTAGLR